VTAPGTTVTYHWAWPDVSRGAYYDDTYTMPAVGSDCATRGSVSLAGYPASYVYPYDLWAVASWHGMTATSGEVYFSVIP